MEEARGCHAPSKEENSFSREHSEILLLCYHFGPNKLNDACFTGAHVLNSSPECARAARVAMSLDRISVPLHKVSLDCEPICVLLCVLLCCHSKASLLSQFIVLS